MRIFVHLPSRVPIIYIRIDYDRRSLRRSYCSKLVRPRDKEGEIGRKGLERKSRERFIPTHGSRSIDNNPVTIEPSFSRSRLRIIELYARITELYTRPFFFFLSKTRIDKDTYEEYFSSHHCTSSITSSLFRDVRPFSYCPVIVNSLINPFIPRRIFAKN